MRTTVATEKTNSKKLYLKSPFFTVRLRTIYQITLVSLLAGTVLASYILHLRLLTAGLLLSLALVSSLVIYQLLKGIVTGSIHGDYLIVTHRLTNKSKVVDVKHLRSIRSVRFLWLRGTKFTYNLNGEIRRVVLLSAYNEDNNVAAHLRELKKAG